MTVEDGHDCVAATAVPAATLAPLVAETIGELRTSMVTLKAPVSTQTPALMPTVWRRSWAVYSAISVSIVFVVVLIWMLPPR